MGATRRTWSSLLWTRGTLSLQQCMNSTSVNLPRGWDPPWLCSDPCRAPDRTGRTPCSRGEGDTPPGSRGPGTRAGSAAGPCTQHITIEISLVDPDP